MFNLENTLEVSKLGYSVETFPVLHPVTSKPTKFFGTYNSSNGEVFATGFTKYNTVQNREAFKVLDNVSNYFPEMEVTKAGSFDGGKTAFISVNIGTINLGGSDNLEKTLTVYNSHDGNSPIVLSTGSFRVLCKNQLHNIFQNSFAKFSHTKSGKMEYDNQAVGMVLERFNKNFEENEKLYRTLVNTKVTKAHLLACVAKLLIKDNMKEMSEKESKKQVTILTDKVGTILGNLRSADNGAIQKDTGWNLYNSIQGMYQHTDREVKDLDKSIMLGTIKDQTIESLKVVSEVCSSSVESFEDLLLKEEIAMLTNTFDFAF